MRTNYLTVFASLILLLTPAKGVVPPPDGAYPNGNTAEGQNALFSLTTGGYNAAVGWMALRGATTANFNTGVGAGALALNNGDQNTAIGAAALLLNASGQNNTATGALALLHNLDGSQNTADGDQALSTNTSGFENTGVGYQALSDNTSGFDNTGIGRQALADNTTGGDNTAVGRDALAGNTTGSNNIALGVGAGVDHFTGDDNIYIGNLGGSENDTIRIGDAQNLTYIAGITGIPVTGTAVVVNVFGQLGVAPSSQRFKQNIAPMDRASESLLALEPVTFRYKKDIDPEGTAQFGLVAEEVEKVDPNLVVHDKQGKAYSVRYDQVNAMLLNEFLKEHKTVSEQQATIDQLKSNSAKQDATIGELTNDLHALTGQVKQQGTQIQKVSARLQAKESAGPLAVNER